MGKKFYIAHRGNTVGSDPLENSPQHVIEALRSGYHAEVDVWSVGDDWYLGHDAPQYQVPFTFLFHPNMWCHAKNVHTLNKIATMGERPSRFFFHDRDECVLTSDGHVWTFPGIDCYERSIMVMPETVMDLGDIVRDLAHCSGVCSDLVGYIRAANELEF